LQGVLGELSGAIEQTVDAADTMDEVVAGTRAIEEDSRSALPGQALVGYAHAAESLSIVADRLREGHRLIEEYIGVLLGVPAPSRDLGPALDAAVGGLSAVSRPCVTLASSWSGCAWRRCVTCASSRQGGWAAGSRKLNEPRPRDRLPRRRPARVPHRYAGTLGTGRRQPQVRPSGGRNRTAQKRLTSSASLAGRIGCRATRAATWSPPGSAGRARRST